MSGPPTVSNSFKSRRIEVTERLSVGNLLSAVNTFTGQLSVGDVQVNTAGSSNVFLGNSTTGNKNTTGNHNLVFGINAGNVLTTGSNNNFMGYRAGDSNTTGGNNNFFGFNTGFNNTAGDSNNFLGNFAGRDNTTGNGNNFLGASAGQNTTTGQYNNFLGLLAGFTNTVGSNNIVIGNQANVATNNLSGVIVLGTYGATATESHQVFLETANVSFKNTGNTFEVGNNALPNNLTVFGNISASQYLNFTTGKTIHVDSVKGTDTRTDLSKYDIGRPFATIAAAAAASVTGDLVYVRAGTYTITSQINLDGKGNMFFETGATVNVASNIVAFSYSQNSVPISILGYANFVLAGGTAGVLTMPSGNATTAVQFECNSISGPNSVTGTLFNCAVGVLSVDAKLIQMTTDFIASSATVFNITGSGVVTAIIPFVYCGVYLNAPSTTVVSNAAASRFNTDVWTLATFNTTTGIAITSITTNLRIINYNHAGAGVAFNWAEDTVNEGHNFIGVKWTSLLGSPNMSFASSVGATTRKIISLRESNVFRGSSTNSLSASVPMNAWVNNSYADVAASANVTFKVGSFTVDPLVGNM